MVTVFVGSSHAFKMMWCLCDVHNAHVCGTWCVCAFKNNSVTLTACCSPSCHALLAQATHSASLFTSVCMCGHCVCVCVCVCAHSNSLCEFPDNDECW